MSEFFPWPQHLSMLRAFLIDLGDISIAIPLALGLALALFCQRAGHHARWWLLVFGLGVILIGAGKLAFGLFGWSIPGTDMYVVSGHAMLTAAVYPTLFGALARAISPRLQAPAIAAGLFLAAVMAVALVRGNDHTVSETLLGSVIGLSVAAAGLSRGVGLRFRPALAIALAPLLCLTLLNIPSPVHAAKNGVWHTVASLLGVSGKYVRYIKPHPETGKQMVVVVPPRHRSPRAGLAPGVPAHAAGAQLRTCAFLRQREARDQCLTGVLAAPLPMYSSATSTS